MTGAPWTFDEAERRHQHAKEAQEATSDEIRVAYRTWAKSQRLYAVALAQTIWDLKRQGIAITACETLARGDERVALLREQRDADEGIKESAKTAAWAANKDREEVAELIRWSFRRELAEIGVGG